MTRLLEVCALSKSFQAPATWADRLARRPGVALKAVDGVGFSLERGRTFGLVGESGCGKSTLARLIVGLERPDAGSAWLDGVDIHATLAGREAPALKRRLQMVFQDPYASLDPRWRVRDIVAEPLRTHGLSPASAVMPRVVELLAAVGLGADDLDKYPHQFSGGQRQRVSIARALATTPELLVCDEATSALDVSVQAQVLNLLLDLQQASGLACLFISHNLAVVRRMSDDVGVMYLGRLVEVAPKESLFQAPLHPYTRLLLDAVPDLRASRRRSIPILADAPDPQAPPSGCAFHPRCPHANERCRVEVPELLACPPAEVACHAVQEGRL